MMDDEDLPDELRTPPEKRLVQTLISQRPPQGSLFMVSLFLLFVVLITQLFWIDFWGFADKLPALHKNVLVQGEWWRIFTATLIHSNLGHLLSNLYMLGIFSYFIYSYFGLAIYPILSFFMAGLVNLLCVYTYPPEVRLLGASGLVYLLGGFWLTMYFFIQRQYAWLQRSLRVLGMALMVFFPTSFEPTTSYRAHFFGFVAGIILGCLYFSDNYKSIQNKEVYSTQN